MVPKRRIYIKALKTQIEKLRSHHKFDHNYTFEMKLRRFGLCSEFGGSSTRWAQCQLFIPYTKKNK